MSKWYKYRTQVQNDYNKMQMFKVIIVGCVRKVVVNLEEHGFERVNMITYIAWNSKINNKMLNVFIKICFIAKDII